MANVKLAAEKREKTGSNAAKALRKAGLIPAVLYGHGEETLHLAVPRAAAQELIFGHAQMVDLAIAGGTTESALVRDTDYDLHSEFVTHIDFLRVSANEPVEVEVEVKLSGTPAKGEKAGGGLDQQAHTVTVKCLPADIPETLELNVAELDMGEALHASDLPLPSGVELITDPATNIVTVHHPAGEADEAPVADEGDAPSEPELIKPARASDEGEGGE